LCVLWPAVTPLLSILSDPRIRFMAPDLRERPGRIVERAARLRPGGLHAVLQVRVAAENCRSKIGLPFTPTTALATSQAAVQVMPPVGSIADSGAADTSSTKARTAARD